MTDLHFWGNIAQALGSFTLIYSFSHKYINY